MTRPPLDGWERVRVTGALDAEVLKAALETAGIPVIVRGEAVGGVIGIGVGSLGDVEMFVPAEGAVKPMPREEISQVVGDLIKLRGGAPTAELKVAEPIRIFISPLTGENSSIRDWSYAEIAQSNGTSRAAVHDLVRRTEATLEDYEARLGLLGAAERRDLDRAGLERRLDQLQSELRELKQAVKGIA